MPAVEICPLQPRRSRTGLSRGVDIFKMMATYSAEMREDGTLYGECPNAGLVIAADGVATFTTTGIGAFTEDGGATFKGMSIAKRQPLPLRA